jgi:hypothetical protein
MLKKAMESAEYYSDTRRRRQSLRCYYEEGIRLSSGRLRSLDYGGFSSCRTLL